jgi:hypothetical protein
LVVLAAAAAATLTGCGAEGRQVSTDLPPMASSSAESTPELPPLGPADLPMPAEARQRTPEGARAFMTYYLEVYNHAQRTLEPTWLRKLSEGCETCDDVASQLESIVADGRGYEGGEVRIDYMSEAVVQGDEAQLTLTTTQDALSATEDGVPIDGLSFPAYTSRNGGAILKWINEQASWQIVQWHVP